MWNKLSTKTRAELLMSGLSAGLTPAEVRQQFNTFTEGGELNTGGETTPKETPLEETVTYKKMNLGWASDRANNNAQMYAYNKRYFNGLRQLKGVTAADLMDSYKAAKETHVYDTNYEKDWNLWKEKHPYATAYPDAPEDPNITGYGGVRTGFTMPQRRDMAWTPKHMEYVTGEEWFHSHLKGLPLRQKINDTMIGPLEGSDIYKNYSGSNYDIKDETRAKFQSFKAMNGLAPFSTPEEAAAIIKGIRNGTIIDEEDLLGQYGEAGFINNVEHAALDKTPADDSPIQLSDGTMVPQYMMA